MKQKHTFAVVGVACCAVLFAAVSSAQEWTRFRGPNGTGVGQGNIPVKWTDADYNWKVELPGAGHSSPVVWGERIFLMSADPETAERYVLCLHAADGRILWNRKYPSESHHLHVRSSYASCTPAVDAERVYVAWSTPAKTTFTALSHEGETAWELDLGRWQSQHGFGASPILYKDKVILFNSQQANQLQEGEKPGESFMMAFDKETGKELWRTPRKSENVCYSVPCIQTNENGNDELLCCSTAEGIFSLDPDTGKENWSSEPFEMRTVASPVTASGLVFGSTGSGGGGNYVVAVRPGSTPEEVYRIETSANYVPTPVAKDDLVFLWYDKGFVTCIDAPTGKVHWRERVGEAFSGSPVRVDDHMYCINEDGDVYVIAADKEFKLLAVNSLGEPSRATPAVSGGRMYLRTTSHLFSIGGKSL